MTPVYIALGANLSNPKETFSLAMKSLEQARVQIQAVSGLWQSPAWPAGSGQPDYINACAKLSYGGSALQLLALLQKIESENGRVRTARNAARTLDLDILDYGGKTMKTPALELPHPRMLSRGFVLFPLAEIAPHWRDSSSGTVISDYIARLPLADIAPMQRLGSWQL